MDAASPRVTVAVFIELAEHLRCPRGHDEGYCVVTTDLVQDRDVVAGAIGCPSCNAEYPIEAGVATFGPPAAGPPRDAAPLPATAEAVQALLHLTNPGGFVVLLGSAARLATALAGVLGGTHVVLVNPPRDVSAGASCSTMVASDGIPLRTGTARGVVIGAEGAVEPWLSEGARVVLRGKRLVVFAEQAATPGMTELAAGDGLWVGERR